MSFYLSKSDIYTFVSNLRTELNITSENYPLDVLSLCKGSLQNIDVKEYRLKTKGLYGICMLGKSVHTIILNSNRTRIERRFDMSHELMHIYFHQNLNHKIFQCAEKLLPNQNSFYEYHANEGAAELLLPYKLLLPDLADMLNEAKKIKSINYYEICEKISSKYEVTPIVADYRIESLSYELSQYINGVPMEYIQIMSRSKQTELGISVHTILDIMCE